MEIIEVLVKPGDRIKAEDSLITLESDKAAMEVPSPTGGIIKTLKVKPGDRVNKGSPILVLEMSDDFNEVIADSPAVTKPEIPAKNSDSVNIAAIKASVIPESDSNHSPTNLEQTEQKVLVPDIGDFKDIEVIEVLVKVGDLVKTEDSLITLESDKAAMEVPSPFSGVVTQLHIKPGDRVNKGTHILTLSSGDNKSDTLPVSQPLSSSGQESITVEVKEAVHAAASQMRNGTVSGSQENTITNKDTTSPHASPAIRKMARELGADLSQVKGNGPKGRILKEDVQNFIKDSLKQNKPTSTPASAILGLSTSFDIDFSKFGPVENKPLTRIQKLSGPNLHRNWISIPHITQHDEADITELEAFRVSLKAESEKQGVKLSLLPFVLKAVVATLKAFPDFNASLSKDGESLIIKGFYHIGVAVDTPEGLVVPVIRNVDQKGIFELTKELSELSAKARNKKLRGPDLEGGCFTISSLGGIGGTGFTPIINAPEVAILGISKSQIKPVWQDDTFVPRLMLPIALSYDHRVIDGAQGARFTVYLSKILSDLKRMIL